METLEIPSYTIREFEKLAGLPKNICYKYIRLGKIRAVVDVCGQYRIPVGEAAYFIRMREQDES